ncbi:MAG: hypothetical protein ACYS9T_10240 [Planctomycetota bacterium]|jgi:hypothetical protein
MRRAICLAVFVLVWVTWSSRGLAADDGPVAWWKFDDGTAAGFESEGFNKYERAYVLSRKANGSHSTLKFELAATEKSPVVNPAFIIKNWGHAAAELKINEEPVKRGKDFRLGHRRTLETTDLIIWIKKNSTRPIMIFLSPRAD